MTATPDHDTWRELLALRLYDELDAHEAIRVDEHLAACADCRRFAVELEHGLGALRPWPVGRPRPPAVRRTTVVAAAAVGFAAGVLLTWAIGSREPDPAPDGARAPGGAFAGADAFDPGVPPPRATCGGRLARLGRYATGG